MFKKLILSVLATVLAVSAVQASSTNPGAYSPVVLGAGQSKTYQETFRGGETARVVLTGLNGSDADLFIYDENGYLIAEGIEDYDDESVSFRPIWTGPFTIVVKNLSDGSNAVRVRTY